MTTPDPTQLDLRPRCPRCGRDLESLPRLAGRADALADAVARLRAAHDRMRSCIPQAFIEALRQLERDLQRHMVRTTRNCAFPLIMRA